MNAYKNRYGFVQLDLTKNGKRSFKKSATFMAKIAETSMLVDNEELT